MTTPIMKRMYNHEDCRRLMQVRAVELEGGAGGKMILEGKAVTFEERTVLFKYDGVEYGEIISRNAFEGSDISKCFLKYAHSDNVMVMARVKNNTLSLDIREDGMYIRAELANTTAGRDLYELVKRGDIDKMSFAWTSAEESYNEKTHTWTVHKIDTLYDVAAVPVPAYDNTQIYARRYGQVEARLAEVEALELKRKRARVSLLINQ